MSYFWDALFAFTFFMFATLVVANIERLDRSSIYYFAIALLGSTIIFHHLTN